VARKTTRSSVEVSAQWGPGRQLGREPGLADARLPLTSAVVPASLPGRVEGTLELPELAAMSDEDLARGSLHPGSIAPPTPGAEGADASRDRRTGTPAAEDTPPDRCAPASASTRIRSTRTETRRPGMTTVAQPGTRKIHRVEGGGGLRLHVREWGRADGRLRADDVAATIEQLGIDRPVLVG
jgi:hypothetical protein